MFVKETCVVEQIKRTDVVSVDRSGLVMMVDSEGRIETVPVVNSTETSSG